jgi:hypothetical protein
MASVLLRLPQFWKNDPGLWFAQMEARFNIHNIDSDDDRFCTMLVATKELSILAQVYDCIRNPLAQDKNQSFKTQLIACCTDSKERQPHRLLTELKFDDKTSSKLLRKMCNLASHGISEKDERNSHQYSMRLLGQRKSQVDQTGRNCWPDPCRSTQSEFMATNNPRSKSHISSQQPAADFSEERLPNVEKQLYKLATAVTSIHTSLKTSTDTSERRSKSRTRSTTPSAEEICRFHRKFRDDAQYCLLS